MFLPRRRSDNAAQRTAPSNATKSAVSSIADRAFSGIFIAKCQVSVHTAVPRALTLQKPNRSRQALRLFVHRQKPFHGRALVHRLPADRHTKPPLSGRAPLTATERQAVVEPAALPRHTGVAGSLVLGSGGRTRVDARSHLDSAPPLRRGFLLPPRKTPYERRTAPPTRPG